MATKPKTPEEKLAAAEKRGDLHFENWKKAVDERADIQQSFDFARGKWEAEKLQLTSEVAGLKEALKLERADTNGLRSIIRDLELTTERFRGYQDGIADSEPPVMVPEKRELRRDSWPGPRNAVEPMFDRYADSSSRLGGRYEPSKPWWHK